MLVSATETPRQGDGLLRGGHRAGHYRQRPGTTSSRSGTGKAGTSRYLPAPASLRRFGKVRRRMAHRVTLIPATGPARSSPRRRAACSRTGVEFDWDVQHAGTDVMDENDGNPLPEHVLESIRQNGTALKGPITTPSAAASAPSTSACASRSTSTARCALQVLPGVRSRYANVDLIVIRENTEDLYAGVEFEEGTEDADDLLDWLGARHPNIRRDSESRSSRSPRRARARSSSSPSTTRAATAAAR